MEHIDTRTSMPRLAETICSHFFEREDHSLPVFSREEKAEYESWDAALVTRQRENATSP